MKKITVIASLYLSIAISAMAYQKVLTVSTPENLGSGRLTSITIANDGTPCVAADGGVMCYIYQKTGTFWKVSTMNVANYFSKQFFNPYVSVDQSNNVWVSGILYPLTTSWTNGKYIPTDSGGIGLICKNGNVMQFSRKHYHPRSWECGNMGYDPVTSEIVVWVNSGNYGVSKYANECPGMNVLTRQGVMSIGNAGEGARIGMSTAGPFVHADGTTHSVWHLASVLHAGYGVSAYQNSDRAARKLGAIGWADGNYYYKMGTDGSYVSVVGDAVVPNMGYMATDLSNDGGAGGVYANVYNGREMVRSVSNIIQVYPTGGSGSRRFEPHMAPAKFGGVFIVFCSGENMYVRYISPVGLLGDPFVVCKGSKGSITSDKAGNLHVAYSDGSALKYRKLGMSTATDVGARFVWGTSSLQMVWEAETGSWWGKTLNGTAPIYGTKWGSKTMMPVNGDYNGDKYGDLAVWDTTSLKWYIYDVKNNAALLMDYSFGILGSKPVPGDYDGDGKSDLAIYDQQKGNWYIVTMDKKTIVWAKAWGHSGAIAVPGDYDGDKKSDLAVFDESQSLWYIYSAARGTNLMWGKKIAEGVPVSGDFDGDGKSDLAVWNNIECKWYIQRLGGKKLMTGFQWGFKGGAPCAGDFDGDGADDIAIYDYQGIIGYGNWYIYSVKKAAMLAWGTPWGYKGVVPAGAAISN